MKHLNTVKKYVNTKTLSVAAVATLASVGAHAELPAGAAAAMTGISTLVDDIIAAAWPIVTAITVGFIGIKLFKKGANKAT